MQAECALEVLLGSFGPCGLQLTPRGLADIGWMHCGILHRLFCVELEAAAWISLAAGAAPAAFKANHSCARWLAT